MSKNEIYPLSRKANIVVQEFEKEILIYDLTENKAFSLNEPSAMIWQACDGNNSVSQIAEKLSVKLNSQITEDFVWLALEQLKKDNLLENAEEVSTDFGGLSRREVIRKIGLATLIALPLVASLIAPTAVHAASTCSGSCRCPVLTPNTPTGNCGGAASASAANGGPYVGCNNTFGGTCMCYGPFPTNPAGPNPGSPGPYIGGGTCKTGP